MEIVMPKMGESVTEGTILKWYKNIGDKVEKDEIIFEISTDKVDTEVPSPTEGTLSNIKVQEGETVEVGTVVAVIDNNGNVNIDVSKVENSEEIKNENTPQTKNVDEKVEGGNSVIEIAMPKMGESVMEGTIIKWFKGVGDDVKKDETIFEISTDKVDTEVPSPVEGKISEILVAEQETVEVGTPVAKISTSSETPISSAEQQTQTPVETSSEDLSMHDIIASNTEGAAHTKQKRTDGSSFLSPLVLNIAQKENINIDELNSIQGSGLKGRVTKNDVLKYIEERVSKPVRKTVVQKQTQTAAFETGSGVTKIPMDNIRQKIMHHMVHSRDTSVHVNEMLEVDMTRIHNFIETNKDKFLNENGIKLTYMAFISDACVKALKKFPLVNSTIDGNTILQKNYVNLGIAVAMEPNGLIVPNIKGAEQRNILGLAKAINDLATNARSKKLSPDDTADGTFTITNYGVFGTVFGTPIINQPEVAILGVGAVTKKPVVIEMEGTDTIAIRHIMGLTLSHDHRLVDGMLGGKFLKYIKDTLETFNDNSF